MKETLIRQSFLGEQSDQVLDGIVVAVIGLGGAGSHVVQQLSHVGVGEIFAVDDDRAEIHNLNRLIGATRRSARLGHRKTDIVARRAKAVNPELRIRRLPKRWQEALVTLRDADVIVSCVDDFTNRSQIEEFARRYLIPCVDIGMDVHEVADHFVIAGQVTMSVPGDICFKCMGLIQPDVLAKEAYGVAGGNPQVVWANGVLASIAVGLVVEMVTPWFSQQVGSTMLQYDGNRQTVETPAWVEHLRGQRCRHFENQELGDTHACWSAGYRPRRGLRRQ